MRAINAAVLLQQRRPRTMSKISFSHIVIESEHTEHGSRHGEAKRCICSIQCVRDGSRHCTTTMRVFCCRLKRRRVTSCVMGQKVVSEIRTDVPSTRTRARTLVSFEGVRAVELLTTALTDMHGTGIAPIVTSRVTFCLEVNRPIIEYVVSFLKHIAASHLLVNVARTGSHV